MNVKKKPYRYASNDGDANKIELWIEHLKAPGFVKLILFIFYGLFIFLPLDLLNGIKSFIYWTYIVLAPFIIIWWIFTMVAHILGHH